MAVESQTGGMQEAVIGVSADASGLKAAMADVREETAGVARSLDSMSRSASRSLGNAADQGAQASKKLERQTQSLNREIERTTALMEAGAKGTSGYFQARAGSLGISQAEIQKSLSALQEVERRTRAVADAERELAATQAFDKKAAETQQLMQASKYVRWWEDALQGAEQQERRLADAKAFDRKHLEAQKLVQATNYARWWEDALEDVERRERAMAGGNEFIQSLERRIQVIGKTNAELLQMRAAELGVTDRAAPLLSQLAATEKRMGAVGMSTAATAAAMRMVPAQMTDIVVSLQGGQAPLTVLLQQGGQLKDMFGGLGPALRAMATYVAGLVTPFTLAAAAVGVFTLAFMKGRDEMDAHERTLVRTGNALGLTTSRLDTMSRTVSRSIGTQGQAARVMDEMASSAKVGADSLEAYTIAALRWEKATGTAVEDTIKAFSDLAKDPLKASLALNEGMNYLTASIYQQIRALEQQGKTVDAVALAQKSYADAINERGPKIIENIGTLERAWKSVGTAAKGAWDFMLGVGRQQSLDDQLALARLNLRSLTTSPFATFLDNDRVNETRAEIVRLEKMKSDAEQAAAADAARAGELRRSQFRLEYLDDDDRNTKGQQRAKAVEKETAAFKKATEGLKQGTEEYQRIYAAHRQALVSIDKKFEDKDAAKGPSGAESEAARLRARIVEEKALASELALRGLQTSKLNEQERRAAEIGELLKGNVKAAARASLERTQALAAEAGALVRANTETTEFLKAREKYTQDLVEGITKIEEEARALEDQVATYGMSKAALERLTIARLDERKTVLAGFGGAEEEIALIEREIEARERLAQAVRGKEIKDARKKALEDEVRDWEKTVDQVGDVFRQGFADMLNEGRSGWKAFTRSLVTSMKTAVADQIYKLFAQPFVVRILAGVAGVFGAGGAAAAAGTGAAAQGALGAAGGVGNALSLASSARSVYSTLTGGFAAMGQGITNFGVEMGSQWIADFGYGFGQGAGAGATTAGAIGSAAGMLAGAGIGFMGGKLISGQYQLGNGNVTVGAGTAVGAAIGSIVPGLGTAIGTMVGGLLGGVFNRAFGRGPKKFGETSFIGDFGELGFNGYTSTPWKQKGGWFSSSRRGTQIGVLDQDLMGDLSAAFELLKSNAASLAGVVGVSADSLATYREQIRVTLTKDDAENQKLLEQAIATVGENMVRALIPNISEFAAEGETASQTLERLGLNLTAANAALKMLGLSLYDVSVAGAATASQLVAAFGSVDALGQATSQYYQLYYSEAERAKISLVNMTEALGDLNIAMPGTMAELRAMVTALDLTTEAGRTAYAVLLTIAPEFAAVVEATTRRSQESAARLLEAFVGRGGLAQAMSAAALQAALLDGALVQMGGTGGQISRLLLDLSSGMLTWPVSAGAVAGAMTGAQEASADLADQIETLRAGVGATIIDFEGLADALADVDAEVFVAAMGEVFQRLADRMRTLLDGITNERIAVRQAARDILEPAPMSTAAIRRGIEGINTALPSNAGLAAAAAGLTQADMVAAQRASARNAVEQAYNATKTANDTATAGLEAAQRRAQEAQDWMAKLEWDIYAPKTVGYKKGNWATLDAARSVAIAQMPAAQNALQQAQAALAAAQAAANAAPSTADVARLAADYAAAVTAAASAQAAATEAAAKARNEQTLYADALQRFAIDAGKSVSRLGELRAETVRYYEAQKALATLMTETATSLRKSVSDYRFSQLSPEDQFASLQGQYAEAYAKAMGADGEALAGYADQLNGLMNPLLQAARDSFSSEAQYQAFVATTLARAEAIAGRLDTLTPRDYQKESLDLLAEIDATLVVLEKSALSGDQVITNAINTSRDATINGLRQIVNALTGGSVATFAAGGMHRGGLRLVGERGPELEVTGPARIYSAEQTRGLLAGGAESSQQVVLVLQQVLAEQRVMREEMQGLRIETRATVSNTGQAARQLQRIESEGLMVRADQAEPLIVEVHQ